MDWAEHGVTLMVGLAVMVQLGVTVSVVDFLSVVGTSPIASHVVALNCAVSAVPLHSGSFGLVVVVAVTIVIRHLVDCLAVSVRVEVHIVDPERIHLLENRPSVHALVAVDMVVSNWMAFAFDVVASSFVVAS